MEQEYKKLSDPLKEKRSILQDELIADMKTQGQYSARFDFATISVSVRKTPKVIDELKTIQSVIKMDLGKEYTAVRLTDSFYDSMPSMIKEGIEIDGVVISETEFLSIRTASEDYQEKRKVVIE